MNPHWQQREPCFRILLGWLLDLLKAIALGLLLLSPLIMEAVMRAFNIPFN